MALLAKRPRIFVLGLDGLPYSFLKAQFGQGLLPNLQGVARESGLKRVNSVYPAISLVAWASYMTGKNPARHNVFGFIDRVATPFSLKIATARDRKAKTIWEQLSQGGQRVIVINVPGTYPPEKINGILISGFLCPDIRNCSYPEDFWHYLKSQGYIIDVEAGLARESKRELMDQIHQAMEKRFALAFELMEKEWNFFQLHIMETDRLFHFFWNDIESGGEYSEDIKSFFEKLDNFIKDLKEKLSGNDRLLILSDHGFCRIKKEVQLNTWLEKEGLLKFEEGLARKLPNYHRDSLCYSLIPGRIFINLEGREEKGTVRRNDYQKIRRNIKERLLNFENPENGEKIISKVFFREEIYQGPYLENAADIIAHPARGYDLKGKVGVPDIFDSSALNGMHIYDDAFICGINCNLAHVNSIEDVKKKCLEL